MPSKYKKLKKTIPELPPEPSEKEKAIAEEMAKFKGFPYEHLTAAYNARKLDKEKADAAVEKAEISLEAVERVILSRLDAEDLDGVKANGYTWSQKTEPYPVVEDGSKMVQHFLDNDQKDLLTMHWQRLKSMTKEDSLAGRLTVEEQTVVDQATGEERTINVVRSPIPGVRVFLKSSLSRVKSKGATE